MLPRRFISVFFILVYTVIIAHDFVPHHYHTDSGSVYNYSITHQSAPCNFPFHQHNMKSEGVFLSTPSVNLEFNVLNLLFQSEIEYADLILKESFYNRIGLVFPVYKGLNQESSLLRAPPLS